MRLKYLYASTCSCFEQFFSKKVLAFSLVQNNKENNEFIEANHNNAIVNARYCP
jgi:hypothetical protein